jgi:hypothetical protein
MPICEKLRQFFNNVSFKDACISSCCNNIEKKEPIIIEDCHHKHKKHHKHHKHKGDDIKDKNKILEILG